MRLISLHEDAVRALERLRVPFDDVTPDGLWGSPYHLIGVTAEQRAVLDSWNLEVNDVTPEMLASFAEAAPQLKESWPQPKARVPAIDVAREPRRDIPAAPVELKPEPSADAEVPVPMHEEPRKHGDPFEREIVERAAQAAESRVDARAEARHEERTDGRAEVRADSAPRSKGATAAFAAPAAAQQHHDPTRLR